MASRRKSTTPCMVPPLELADSDPDMDVTEGEEEALEEEAAAAAVLSAGSQSSDKERQAIDHYIKTMDLSPTEGGYECKYCSFQTSELNMFTIHVDTEHPNIVLNSSYVCVECDFQTRRYDALLEHNARHHPGEDNFTRTMVKRNNQTIFEQTVNDLTFNGGFVKTEEEEDEEGDTTSVSCRNSITLSKTPIMKVKSRESKSKFTTGSSHKMADTKGGAVIKVESDDEPVSSPPPVLLPPAVTASHVVFPTPTPTPSIQPIQPVHHHQSMVITNHPNTTPTFQMKHINSSGATTTMLPPGTLAQVLSALQNQQNLQNQNHHQTPQTQILIPVSSIPTYNGAMDNNVLLVGAYNRFPYPSVSEIMGLSAQTKFSEEQIKVWFSAQRLKHGVSWTPEEVEEARRKKFNGSVNLQHATTPQTITVIPANLAAAATNGLQSIFQTCQIVSGGQRGLVLTQVGGGCHAVAMGGGGGRGNAIPVTSPITLTVAAAGLPSHQASVVMPTLEPPPSTSEAPPFVASALSPDPHGAKPKKSKEQLAELKASYLRRQIATEAEITRLMKITNLTKRAIKKWFSDTRYNQRNSKDHQGGVGGVGALSDNIAVTGGSCGGVDTASGGPSTAAAAIVIDDTSDDTNSDYSPTTAAVAVALSPVVAAGGPASDPRVKFRNFFPDFTPQKFKEKTPEQLSLLEASFLMARAPADEELSRLRSETKLTRREVDAWFTERRKMLAAAADADGLDEGDGGGIKATASGSHESQTVTTPGGRKILKKTPQQLHVLKSAFVRTQWPSSEEYDKMAEESGLPRTYIVNWFGDTRYACKNSNLKWYYLYQSGKVNEAMNGGGGGGGGGSRQRKPRKRFRGWSRRTRRPYPCKQSPAQAAAAAPVKPKTGKEVLKEHYLKHKVLNEKDLDELVSRSSMSYEQVRDWFAEISRRVEEGGGPFSDGGGGGGGEEETQTQGGDSERETEEMEVKEQGEEEEEEEEEGGGTDDDNEEEEDTNDKGGTLKDESEEQKEPQCVKQTESEDQ